MPAQTLCLCHSPGARCAPDAIRRPGMTPDGPRPELLIPRLEVKVMYGVSQVFRSLQPALHKCLVDDHLCRDVRQFASVPHFDLLSHRFEVPLHTVDTNRNAIDERE
jgi:hypothetical protein